ncbi:hypothetical protein Tco_0158354 [Tanacetum coccineum]
MLKKHNKDVKYGYANPCPSDANAEYLCYYEEEVEERLNHCDQMRRWEIYVNGRPLGSRRDWEGTKENTSLLDGRFGRILCLGDRVLPKVTKETSVAGIWTKLTSLYITKSLANRLYLKKNLYTYYMSPGMKLVDHIYEFNKFILDLTNIDIEIEDEDQALMLLASLTSSYKNVMETLLYGRGSLTMEDLLATLISRELKK